MYQELENLLYEIESLKEEIFKMHEEIEILKEKDSVHVDEIYMKSGLSSTSIAAAMLNLELQNVIISMPGKMYKLG